jgi:hypothetical protein
VNFAVGQSLEADVAFHFNPRFDGWDKVVFNSRQGGQWGSEEKKRSMPFSKGKPFELVFMVQAEHYKVRAPLAATPPPAPPSRPLPPFFLLSFAILAGLRLCFCQAVALPSPTHTLFGTGI